MKVTKEALTAPRGRLSNQHYAKEIMQKALLCSLFSEDTEPVTIGNCTPEQAANSDNSHVQWIPGPFRTQEEINEIILGEGLQV